MLAKAKEDWKLEIEPDPADPLVTRITAEKMLEDKLENIKGQLAELENVNVEIMKKMNEIKDGKGSGKGERQGLTSRRNFHSLPVYEGKHETYNHWKFKMKVFLNEDKEVKELMAVLESVKSIPESKIVDEVVVKDDTEKLFDKVDEALAKNGGERCNRYWLNQQLFQVLCLSLQGKALASVELLDNEDLKDVNGIIGWCKLA